MRSARTGSLPCISRCRAAITTGNWATRRSALRDIGGVAVVGRLGVPMRQHAGAGPHHVHHRHAGRNRAQQFDQRPGQLAGLVQPIVETPPVRRRLGSSP